MRASVAFMVRQVGKRDDGGGVICACVCKAKAAEDKAAAVAAKAADDKLAAANSARVSVVRFRTFWHVVVLFSHVTRRSRAVFSRSSSP